MTEKNRRKLEAKKNRVWFPMNTGTRTHNSKKDYKRVKRWDIEK
jgi:hypothetical protein